MNKTISLHRKKMFLILGLSLITLQFCDKKEEIPMVILPTLTTTEITEITNSTATTGGVIQDEGNAWVQWSGVCWSTSPNPTLDDFKTQDHSGIGPFTSYLTNLNSKTTYYVRAYAINKKGTAYGDQKEFTTELSNGETGIMVDDRDGTNYNIVRIGDQIWFAENLNFETPNSWNYNDSASYGSKYGRLYTFEAATAACPTGWHLSTDDEWKKLEILAGMSPEVANYAFFRGTNQGTKLKATSGWADNENGTDNYGFKCLPGGYRLLDKTFVEAGINAVFWTSTRDKDIWTGFEGAYGRAIFSGTGKILRSLGDEGFGMSVRCVKD